MNTKGLQKRAYACALKRGKLKRVYGQAVDTLSTLKAIYNEWHEARQAYMEANQKEFETEVADIAICLLTLAENQGFDLGEAIEKKMEFNEKREK